MNWKSLGTLSPGIGWLNYPETVRDCETLKILQTWGSDRPISYALIAQYFPGEGLGIFHKIWAIDREPRIVIFPVPSAFKSIGINSYQIQVKLGKFPHIGVEDWRIEIQALVSGG